MATEKDEGWCQHHHHLYSYTEYNNTYQIQKYNVIEQTFFLN